MVLETCKHGNLASQPDLRVPCAEQTNLSGIVGQAHDFLKLKTNLLEHLDRSIIVRRGYSNDPIQAVLAPCSIQYGPGCFCGKTLRPELWNETESNIRGVKRSSLKQSAHAYRGTVFSMLNEVQAKSVLCVAGNGPFSYVPARIIQCPDALVSHEFQERRFVEEPEDEWCIIFR